MMARLREDASWLAGRADREGRAPRLSKFSGDGEALASQQETVMKIGADLDRLYAEDNAAINEQLPRILQLSGSGGASAAESQRRARALAQRAGCEVPLTIQMLAKLSISSAGEKELRALNPLLSDTEAAQVMQLTVGLLLLINRAALFGRALAVSRRLLRALDGVKNAQAKGTAAQVAQAASGARVIADQLAAMLCFRRAHVRPAGATGAAPAGVVSAGPTLDPRMLLFEFSAGIVLRPAQVELVEKLLAGASAGRSMCHQLLMGEGKTTVITPLLALLLANGAQLVMSVVPSTLLAFSLGVLRSVFRSPALSKPVWTFRFDRRTSITPQLLWKAQAAVAQRAVMVSTPSAVKAFMLKLLELLHLLDRGMYPQNHSRFAGRLRKLLGIGRAGRSDGQFALDKPSLEAQAARGVRILDVWRGAVALIDEVDVVLHPLKSELNWPLGDKHALDFAPARWELPWHLLDVLFLVGPNSPKSVEGAKMLPAEVAVLERIRAAVDEGIQQSVIGRIPHLALLSDEFYHQKLRPVLAEWLLLWLRRNGLRELTDEQALGCLMRGVRDDESIQAQLTDRSAKSLNLGADWLGSLLPHVFKKVSRVHFGLLLPHEMHSMRADGVLPRSRRFLAVPFVGKDAPSPASEYAHSDVAVGLSILAYRHEGLRQPDFGTVIQNLKWNFEGEIGPDLKRPSSQMWISWIEAAGRRVRGTKAMRRHAAMSQDSTSYVGTGGRAAGGDDDGTPRSAAVRRLQGGGASPSLGGNSPPAPRAEGAAEEVEAAVSASLGGDANPEMWDILPLHLLDLMDVEYMNLLYQLLRRSAPAIRFYLETIVFPDTTAHQNAKLSANGQDLGGEMLFSRRVAFSGTPSSLLPLEMGECMHQLGDDARMLRTLTDPAVVVSYRELHADWDVRTLLAQASPLGRVSRVSPARHISGVSRAGCGALARAQCSDRRWRPGDEHGQSRGGEIPRRETAGPSAGRMAALWSPDDHPMHLMADE